MKIKARLSRRTLLQGTTATGLAFFGPWKHNHAWAQKSLARYQKRWPGVAIDVPGNVSYNGYVAMRELIRAIERAGTTNNIAVIKALEGHRMSAVDRMQHYDAWIDPSSHHVQQTVYLCAANDKPVDNTDYFKIVTALKPEDVKDPGESACKLESYQDTPSYEM